MAGENSGRTGAQAESYQGTATDQELIAVWCQSVSLIPHCLPYLSFDSLPLSTAPSLRPAQQHNRTNPAPPACSSLDCEWCRQNTCGPSPIATEPWRAAPLLGQRWIIISCSGRQAIMIRGTLVCRRTLTRMRLRPSRRMMARPRIQARTFRQVAPMVIDNMSLLSSLADSPIQQMMFDEDDDDTM